LSLDELKQKLKLHGDTFVKEIAKLIAQGILVPVVSISGDVQFITCEDWRSFDEIVTSISHLLTEYEQDYENRQIIWLEIEWELVSLYEKAKFNRVSATRILLMDLLVIIREYGEKAYKAVKHVLTRIREFMTIEEVQRIIRELVEMNYKVGFNVEFKL